MSEGAQGLTIIAGTAPITLIGDIGYTVPPGNLDMTGSAIAFEADSVVAEGTHSYHASVTIAEDIKFVSLGAITFDSTVNPALGATPDLSLFPGGGALTFTASVGDAPFKSVRIFDAGSVSAQDITAEDLFVAGGLPSIFLNGDVTLSGEGGILVDGGPIYFGGEISAVHAWFRAHDTMVNLGSPKPINVSGTSSLVFEYFNTIGGDVGSPSSPIELNTRHQSNLGADSRADFIGDPFHGVFLSIPSNPPCIVTFNDVTILDCNTETTLQESFNSIPKSLWYITWLYSS